MYFKRRKNNNISEVAGNPTICLKSTPSSKQTKLLLKLKVNVISDLLDCSLKLKTF